VDGNTVKIKVETGATILKNSGRVALSKIKPLDTVTAFGLTACDTDTVNFFGYIVVVEGE